MRDITQAVDDVHRFWFGELDEAGMCDPVQHRQWFSASAVTDEQCRSRFGDLVPQAIAGDLDDWAQTDRGLIALVLLLDQFTRNIYRGTPAAFSGDPAALALTRHSITSGRHQRLPAIHQVFLYLPLEHSEELAAQELCVTLFEQLSTASGNAQIADFGRYARAHRDVIARFRRFPHRNEILGRQSSQAELAYLANHKGF